MKRTCYSDPLDLHNPMTACIGRGTKEAMPITQPIKIAITDTGTHRMILVLIGTC